MQILLMGTYVVVDAETKEQAILRLARKLSRHLIEADVYGVLYLTALFDNHREFYTEMGKFMPKSELLTRGYGALNAAKAILCDG
jgi:hypothetical protein